MMKDDLIECIWCGSENNIRNKKCFECNENPNGVPPEMIPFWITFFVLIFIFMIFFKQNSYDFL